MENGHLGVRIPMETLFDPAQTDYVPAPLRCVVYRDGTLSNSRPNYLTAPTPALTMEHEVLYQTTDSCAIQIRYTFDKPIFYSANNQELEPAGPGYYNVTFRMVKGEKACMITEESDYEVGYEVKLSDGVSPDKGRYEGHRSTSIANGYDINASQYQKGTDPGWNATVDLTFDQRREFNLLARWDPWVVNSGWHWQMYDSSEPGEPNVFGIFDGRPSLLRGASFSGAGLYTEPASLTDFHGSCDPNGNCHYVWLTENELWHKYIDSTGTASDNELIDTDVINPFVFFHGNTVNVLAFAPLETAGNQARLYRKTGSGAFQAHTLDLDGSTISDPYLYGASNAVHDFILFNGTHDMQDGLHLFGAPSGTNTFVHKDFLIIPTTTHSFNRPDFRAAPSGKIVLAYTRGPYQYYSVVQADTFAVVPQFPLGQKGTCGMAVDNRDEGFYWLEYPSGAIHNVRLNGADIDTSYITNLNTDCYNGYPGLPNRRSFTTDNSGNGLASQQEGNFYWFDATTGVWSELTGGAWGDIKNAHVHFNPGHALFYIVGKYQGKLTRFTYYQNGNLFLMDSFSDTERKVAGARSVHRRLSPAGRYARHIRFQWGIFADEKANMPPADQVQPIARVVHRMSGFANKLDSFENDPASFSPDFENGAIYIPSADLADIVNEVKNNQDFYNEMSAIDPVFKSVLDAWRDPTAAKTLELYNALANNAESVKTALSEQDGIYNFFYQYTNGGNFMRNNTLLMSGLMADTDPSRLDSDQRDQLKKYAAMYARILWDHDFVPNFDTSGMNAGFTGNATAHENYKWFFAMLLKDDPDFSDRADEIPGLYSLGLSAHINAYGAAKESPHYMQPSIEGFIYTALQLKNAGITNKFQSSDTLHLFSDFYMHLLTPPSVRFSENRKLVCFGDGSEESSALFGLLGTGFAGSDDDLSKRLMYAYRNGPARSSNFGYVTMTINHNLPDDANLPLGNAHYPGYLSTFRKGFGTDIESSLWFINGDWFNDHRNDDRGALAIYALGAPLSLNYGSFYSPFVPGAHMKNTPVPASIFPEWDQADQPFFFPNELTWDSSRHESHLSFEHSGYSKAVFKKSNEWTRRVFFFQPRPATPMFVIKDEMSNTGDDYIWNLNFMSEDSVGTPEGSKKAPPKIWNFMGGPNERPAASDLIDLDNGLNRFDFTGSNWMAHPAGGIDWEVYIEQPEPGTATLANWAHTFIPSVELDEFKVTNNVTSFAERQTILRVKGKESFLTVIVPYHKGQRPQDLDVTKSNDTLQISTDDFMFKTNLDFYTYQDNSNKVLTTYSTSAATFNGATVSGGPIELEMRTDTIYARLHGPSGIREVTMPPGNWVVRNPSPNVVYNNGIWELGHTFTDSLQNSFSGGFTEYMFVRGARVAPKVFLDGPYNSTNSLMNDQLRSDAYLPVTEPYSALSFAHHSGGGGETIRPGVLDVTGEDAIVDWVFVELRDMNNPANVVATRCVLVQRDGDVVDVDGVSPISFYGPAGGEYYLAIRHRNHLGVCTAAAVDLDVAGTAVVDFTLASTPTWGTHAQKNLTGGKRGLWSGNGNNDNKIVYAGSGTDVTPISAAVLLNPLNTTFSPTLPLFGYHRADFNMDGKVVYAGSGTDVTRISSSVILHPANTTFSPTLPIFEQLP